MSNEVITPVDPGSTLLIKVHERAHRVVEGLYRTMVDQDLNYLSTETVEILKAVNFKQLLIEEGLIEDSDPSWLEDSMIVAADKMIQSGEYKQYTEHPYWPFYSVAVDSYIDNTRHNMDAGYEMLVILKQFAGELTQFMENINKNINTDLVKTVEEFFTSSTSKFEALTQLANLVSSFNN